MNFFLATSKGQEKEHFTMAANWGESPELQDLRNEIFEYELYAEVINVARRRKSPALACNYCCGIAGTADV